MHYVIWLSHAHLDDADWEKIIGDIRADIPPDDKTAGLVLRVQKPQKRYEGQNRRTIPLREEPSIANAEGIRLHYPKSSQDMGLRGYSASLLQVITIFLDFLQQVYYLCIKKEYSLFKC